LSVKGVKGVGKMAAKSSDESEETKINVRKSDVTIASDGSVTIKDKRLLDKLATNQIRSEQDLAADEVSVGVVVSKSF